MAIYTIHAPSAGRRPDDPTAFVAIKDGFCWPALFIPLVWTVYRRLWVVLCLAILGLVIAVLALLVLLFATPRDARMG